jgi:hypothetical protein
MSPKPIVALGLVALVAVQAASANAAPIPKTPGSALTVAEQETPRQTETLLRTLIEEIRQGNPDLSRMDPALQQAMRQQMPATTTIFQQLGALRTIE